ncbi:MAG: chromosome segregation protein SMC [Coriobacteriia bacterium]|nr:chromosome segregation protein SMC [Coriobacteriia bacterium]
MHLKSLTLKGFKSFADRSKLALEPGVTVVVGPNGSGKSNISDAVLWVLGEQSAKSLRGTSMEDVIFAGSSARQAVGVAEVDLVLDNADHALPLEFAEVTITRRMFRNGESEYLLNGTPSRLMDIHDLLHDSGLGRDTHSIISQGRLEEVLNSRPEDRRTLIEEAAGVLKHKKRKERALRKLSATDAHVMRAKDVLVEIERQLRPLERQASRATEHAELAEELGELEVALAVDELRALQARWDGVLKREREADAAVELARYRLIEKERELEKFQSLLEEKGLFVGDLSEQRRRLQSVLERLNSGLLLLEEKGKHLVERLSELRQKLHHSQSRSTARSSELERLTEERSAADARLKALYTALSEVRREAEAVKKERLAAEEALNAVNGELRRTRKEVDDARADLAKLEQALSAYGLEDRLLVERGEAVRSQRSSTAAALSGRRGKLEQTEAALARTRKESALAASDVDRRVRVLEARRRDLEERRERLAEVRAEVRALEEVDRAFATASPAMAWALSKQREIPGFLGPLAELISAEEPHERLVEQALGPDLFCLVVEDRSSAAELAGMLRANDAGDVSILPLAGLVPLCPEGAGEPLAAAVSCDARMRPAVEALLGDVFVLPTLADSLSAAQERPGPRYASADGALVFPSGKVALAPAGDSSTGVLTRKRRINELRDESAAVEAAVGEAEAVAAAAEEALDAAQQDALELGQRLAALTGERDSLRDDVGRVEQALTGLDAEARSVADRLAALRSRSAKEAPGKAALAERIASAEARIEELEEQSVRRRDERDGRFREEAAIATKLSSCQVDIATVSEREVHLKRQVATITAELAELAATAGQSRRTEEGLELLRERIQPVHDLYAALLQRAEHWALKLRDRARFEQADSESLRETIHSAQEAVKAVQAEIDEASGAMNRVQVEKGQLEVQVTAAVGRIVDGLGVPLERALAAEPLEDRALTLDAAHRLRKRIANLGPVNAVAVEEYETLKGRREFIASQVEDLVASRQALQRVVGAIDRKVRDLFLATFEEVDRNFQEVFAALFPGGRASLHLTEPDDPETTGVEVVAQPVGKKLAKMSLLSGGEKSLTALALLFAVYRTRPCPFYILDEVEAALDDTNLRRFIAFVDGMRSMTQVVIVTHQRRTMEMADVLYGVSMQADGVSKVVSQKLDRTRSVEESTDEPAVV